MKPESENLTARESLDIIAAMIQEAKGNVQRNSFFFLLWGWVVIIANMGMYALSLLDYRHPYIAWLITIPAWFITFYKVYRMKETGRVTSHLDRITGWLWMTYGLTIFLLVLFGYRINFQINPVVLLMTAIPTMVSGMILKFKPLVFGGILFWISGAVCFLVGIETQPLVSAFGTAVGYLIPGYMLKSKKEL